MTAEELAQLVRMAIWNASNSDYAGKHHAAHDASERITGIGQESYQVNSNEQAFESYSLEKMLTGLREELLDTINYAVMADVLAQRQLNDLKECDMAANELSEAIDGWPATIKSYHVDEDGVVVLLAIDGGDSVETGVTYGVGDRVMLVPYHELEDGETEGDAVLTLGEWFQRFSNGTLRQGVNAGDEQSCDAVDDRVRDGSDAPAASRAPLFGLTFTVDSISRGLGEVNGADVVLDAEHGCDEAIVGHVANAWETSIGNEYVLVPRRVWEEGGFS